MPRGKPLSDDELTTLAELYAETFNASAVAAEMKVAVSTVTRNLARLGEQKRAKLQRDALSAALAQSGDALSATVDDLRDYLREGLESHSLEPSHVASLAQGLARCAAALSTLDSREERRRQSRLTRERTRAEIERLRKGELVTPEQVLAALAALPREDLQRVVASLRAKREASTPTSGGA